MKRVLIIEREYGCGAGEVARKAAERLGWRLLDRELTSEIARRAKIDPAECARREERVDSWLYRLGKVFWRGSYERMLSVEGPEVLDADRMLDLIREMVLSAAEEGRCVIVGRGAPYFLRNRADTFSTFLYGPHWAKVERVAAQVNDRGEAERLVETVDQDRSAFVQHYFGKRWPNRHLYHLMINTVIGIDPTVELLLGTMAACEQNEATSLDTE